MNGLALCAGIGGLELGISLTCSSYTTVCYVEREAYNASCLVARMEDGLLDQAPVWDDLATFDGKPWRGTVDLVTAGFPCQPFSAAGKRLQERDERHLWPQIARIVEEVDPALVFLENVSLRAFREPFRDLRRMGFEVPQAYACTAAELGAGHLRRRVFVLAYRPGYRLQRYPNAGSEEVPTTSPNAPEQSRRPGDPAQERSATGSTVEGPASVDSHNQPTPPIRGPQGKLDQSTETTRWWSREPPVERLVHGVSCRVERDRALGNAVVPTMATKAWRELTQNLILKSYSTRRLNE